MSEPLARVAALLTSAAQTELLPLFARVAHYSKADGSLVTAADTAMQRRVQADLKRQWPDYGFIGEEMTEPEQAQALKSASALWCLDPLDGTTNFASGLPFFAVSLCLLREGRPALAWTYDPVRDECFTAEQGRGAWLNGQALAAPGEGRPLRQCVGVVDFKRLRGRLGARLIEDPPYRSQRNFGSCALEWCWLAAGRFDLYLHGGQKLWDYAAGRLILAEAGGHAQTIAGEELRTDRLAPRSVLAARNAEVFAAWRAWVGLNV